MAKRLEPVNSQAGEPIPRVWTLGDWTRDIFLPLSRRKWKLSTASTTGDRIRKHLITDLGALETPAVRRDRLVRAQGLVRAAVGARDERAGAACAAGGSAREPGQTFLRGPNMTLDEVKTTGSGRDASA